jgi:hypothetical protein
VCACDTMIHAVWDLKKNCAGCCMRAIRCARCFLKKQNKKFGTEMKTGADRHVNTHERERERERERDLMPAKRATRETPMPLRLFSTAACACSEV